MCYTVLIWTLILSTLGNNILLQSFNWHKTVHYIPTDKINASIRIRIGKIWILTSFVTSLIQWLFYSTGTFPEGLTNLFMYFLTYEYTLVAFHRLYLVHGVCKYVDMCDWFIQDVGCLLVHRIMRIHWTHASAQEPDVEIMMVRFTCFCHFDG